MKILFLEVLEVGGTVRTHLAWKVTQAGAEGRSGPIQGSWPGHPDGGWLWPQAGKVQKWRLHRGYWLGGLLRLDFFTLDVELDQIAGFSIAEVLVGEFNNRVT